MSPQLVELIVRLGRENRSWGCVRIQGELRKLGILVRATSVRRVLRHHGLGPAPRQGPTWAEFLRSEAKGILATDFFTVDSVLFKRLYVLFAIEHASRRARLLGASEHPGNAFVTQVARNLVGALAEAGRRVKFLIRDRDTKFTASFDWTLVLGRHHLEAVLREYIRHYNEQRPHRDIELGVPACRTGPKRLAGFAVHRHDVLGGLIHEYRPVAA
jgi:hypothetical protein